MIYIPKEGPVEVPLLLVTTECLAPGDLDLREGLGVQGLLALGDFEYLFSDILRLFLITPVWLYHWLKSCADS